MLVLLAPTAQGWALARALMLETEVTAPAGPLVPVRHRHRHGHWHHRHAYWPGDDEAEAALPEAAPPAVSALPQPIERSLQNTPGTTSRGSGSSRPAIRWVDPEKSPR